jgi:hypothetical protein
VRHPIDVWAELTPDESNRGHWVRLSDIGLNGCYCWTTNTLPVLARVRMTMNLSKSKVTAMAIVRTCHPTAGMGIEFTAMASPEDRRQLNSFLATLQESKQVATIIQQEPDSVSLAERLEEACTQLSDIEQCLKSSDVDSVVLDAFRRAHGQMRSTAWAIQRWLELRAVQGDASPVFSHLNNERTGCH